MGIIQPPWTKRDRRILIMAGKSKGNGGRVIRSYEHKIAQGIPKRLALHEAMGGETQEKTIPKPKK